MCALLETLRHELLQEQARLRLFQDQVQSLSEGCFKLSSISISPFHPVKSRYFAPEIKPTSDSYPTYHSSLKITLYSAEFWCDDRKDFRTVVFFTQFSDELSRLYEGNDMSSSFDGFTDLHSCLFYRNFHLKKKHVIIFTPL
jgi:hypothetical protein